LVVVIRRLCGYASSVILTEKCDVRVRVASNSVAIVRFSDHLHFPDRFILLAYWLGFLAPGGRSKMQLIRR
jgi:hypothetical protein